MKNVHILATDKPSRLGYLTKKGKQVFNDLRLFDRVMPNILDSENQHLYITNDEKIKEGDWLLSKEGIVHNNWGWNFGDKKIILTTDEDLINDGIQAIDDEFLEWFVKNPSCEKVEVKTRYVHYYKTGETFISLSKTPEFSSRNMQCIKIEPRYEIIIPIVEPKQEKLTYTESAKKEERISNSIMMKRKQETLEEVAERYGIQIYKGKMEKEFDKKCITETLEEAAERLWLDSTSQLTSKNSFIQGAKWQQEQMYSEEDLISFAHFYFREEFNSTMQNSNKSTDEILQEWFNQFKKK